MQMVTGQISLKAFVNLFISVFLIKAMLIIGNTLFNIGEIGIRLIFSFLPFRCFAEVTEIYFSSISTEASYDRRKPV